MTSFLKKFTTRSRGNSYVDDDDDDDYPSRNISSPRDPNRPPTSYQSPGSYAQSPQAQQHHPQRATSASAALDKKDLDSMYPRHDAPPYHAAPIPPPSSGARAAAMSNGAGGMRPTSHGGHDSMRDSGFGEPMTPGGTKMGGGAAGGSGSLQAPDLLTHAFNEALRPHTEKIEMLEQQLADMQDWVTSQEQQRMEIYQWIDKRGLRPDVPPAIAKQMDETPDAAAALNQQLDRKITIVNFDLHRLQDDLNDSISSAHFASAMAKFLPDIQRLASLRTGPRFAYELLIKLVGNLNSHGGIEASLANGASTGSDAGLEEELAEDRRARSAFYARMDEELVDVVRRRAGEGEDWPVPREVKRLEKNAAYLKNLGIDSYFPRALDVMRREVGQKELMGTPPRY